MNHLSDAELLAAFDLEPGDEILSVHGHPDDESMAHNEVVTRLTGLGIRVRGLTATNGTKSTEGDPLFVRLGGRKMEAMLAWFAMGVPISRQHYLDMQDGELHYPQNGLQLAAQIGAILVKHPVKLILTPGEQGFDGHGDHKAVHQAAMAAAQEVGKQGGIVSVWGTDILNPDITIPVDEADKRYKLALNGSQFRGADLAAPPTQTQEYLARYPELLSREGYTQYWPPLGALAANETFAAMAT